MSRDWEVPWIKEAIDLFDAGLKREKLKKRKTRAKAQRRKERTLSDLASWRENKIFSNNALRFTPRFPHGSNTAGVTGSAREKVKKRKIRAKAQRRKEKILGGLARE